MATRGADNRYTFAHTHTLPQPLALCRQAPYPCGILTDLHPVESRAHLLRMALAPRRVSLERALSLRVAALGSICEAPRALRSATLIFCSGAFCLEGCAFVCLVVLLNQMQLSYAVEIK
jgi:hypothetical protein